MERRKDVKKEFFVRCRRTYVLKKLDFAILQKIVRKFASVYLALIYILSPYYYYTVSENNIGAPIVQSNF